MEWIFRYLLEEISKVKLQKADLRVRFMELERENTRLKADKDSAERKMKDVRLFCYVFCQKTL